MICNAVASFTAVFFFTAGVRRSGEVVQKGYHVQKDIGVFVYPRGDVHTVPRYTVHSRTVAIVDGKMPWGGSPINPKETFVCVHASVQ